jgi:hypothetical protein
VGNRSVVARDVCALAASRWSVDVCVSRCVGPAPPFLALGEPESPFEKITGLDSLAIIGEIRSLRPIFRVRIDEEGENG